MWIGCSDIRVPANVITGLKPGEVPAHRNVANLVHRADVSLPSVLKLAVETLEVRNIVVFESAAPTDLATRSRPAAALAT